MKRLLAAVLMLAAWASISYGALGGPCKLENEGPIKWRTSAAATVGVYTDSTVFKADGSAAANRDTSAWIPADRFCPWSASFASAGDSTLFATFTISPRATDPYSGSTFGIGADSLYAYVEGTSDINANSGRLLTNLTEILATETNSDNTFAFRISYARAALALNGFTHVRIIVRGDLNGCWEGRMAYHKRLE